jgi:hypothetical protein
MFSLSNFTRNDFILRILPGILLLLFIAIEFREELTTNPIYTTTEIFILIVIASYPLGIILEQFAVTIKRMLLEHTIFFKSARLSNYLGYNLEEFWNKYIKLYSKCKPELLDILDYYNLLRCFFLNMATITSIAVLVHIISNKQIFSILNCSLFILLVIFIMYHFRNEHYYYYIFTKLTGDKQTISEKERSRLLKILKMPMPLKFTFSEKELIRLCKKMKIPMPPKFTFSEKELIRLDKKLKQLNPQKPPNIFRNIINRLLDK